MQENYWQDRVASVTQYIPSMFVKTRNGKTNHKRKSQL